MNEGIHLDLDTWIIMYSKLILIKGHSSPNSMPHPYVNTLYCTQQAYINNINQNRLLTRDLEPGQ